MLLTGAVSWQVDAGARVAGAPPTHVFDMEDRATRPAGGARSPLSHLDGTVIIDEGSAARTSSRSCASWPTRTIGPAVPRAGRRVPRSRRSRLGVLAETWRWSSWVASACPISAPGRSATSGCRAGCRVRSSPPTAGCPPPGARLHPHVPRSDLAAPRQPGPGHHHAPVLDDGRPLPRPGVEARAELARALGVPVDGRPRHLDALTDALVIRQLNPGSPTSASARCLAQGLRPRQRHLARLLGIAGQDDLIGHPKVGASWEGFVVEQSCSGTTSPTPGSGARTPGPSST